MPNPARGINEGRPEAALVPCSYVLAGSYGVFVTLIGTESAPGADVGPSDSRPK